MKAKVIIPKELIEKTNEEIIKARSKKDPWDKETRDDWNEKMDDFRPLKKLPPDKKTSDKDKPSE